MNFCVVASVYSFSTGESCTLEKHVQANNAEEAIDVFQRLFDREHSEFLDRHLVEVLTVYSI